MDWIFLGGKIRSVQMALGIMKLFPYLLIGVLLNGGI